VPADALGFAAMRLNAVDFCQRQLSAGTEGAIAEQAHYLGHQDAVKPSLSVLENLQFWAEFFGDRAIKVHEALEAVGLGGPIWLLDEPASTLDTAGKERLAGFMRSHLAEGGLILAATHGELGLSAAQELSLDQKNHSHVTEALKPAEAAP
jgi:ABC-type transport system involved in cytochrome c biogenesis ATPase subunit